MATIISRSTQKEAQCTPFVKSTGENRYRLSPICDQSLIDSPNFKSNVLVETSDDGVVWAHHASCQWEGGAVTRKPKREMFFDFPAPAIGKRVRVSISNLKIEDVGLNLDTRTITKIEQPRRNSVGVVGTPDSIFGDGASTVSFALDAGAGSNKGLVVGVSTYPTATVSSCTYNSVAVGAIGSATDADGTIVYLRGLKAPASGSNTLAVTMSGAGDLSLGGIGLENVDQTTPFGTPGTDVTGGASNSVTLTDGDTGDLHIAATACWADSNNGSGNPAPGNTARVEEFTEGADACLDMESEVGSTSTAMSYTYPGTQSVSSASAMIAVTVFEAAAAATGHPHGRLPMLGVG